MTFIILYSISFIGGILYLSLYDSNKYMIAMTVLIERFGVAGSFNTTYIATVALNPSSLVSTVIGICNIFAMIMTVSAPQIAELSFPLPPCIFCSLVGLAILITLVLRIPKPEVLGY
jgi:hypothetical protein